MSDLAKLLLALLVALRLCGPTGGSDSVFRLMDRS
jgi:hypothetical protein